MSNDNNEGAGYLIKAFGANVRNRRNELGITRDELALRADISVDMIGRIERQLNGLSFERLEHLATALDTTPVILLGGHDPNFKDVNQKREAEFKQIYDLLSPLDNKQLGDVKDVLVTLVNKIT